MLVLPPISTRTDTLFPYASLFLAVILRYGAYANTGLAQCNGIGNRVLGRVAPHSYHIAVPAFACDGIGHAFGHDDFLVFLGERQRGKGNARRNGTDNHIGVILGVGLFDQCGSRRRVALPVLDGVFDLAPRDPLVAFTTDDPAG